MSRERDPGQLSFECLFAAPTCIPQGDGSVIVRPGRPITRLTPAQLAQQIGVSRSSVYRYLDETPSVRPLVERAGPRKLLIAAEALSVLRAQWRRE